jgi:hypothetical protein
MRNNPRLQTELKRERPSLHAVREHTVALHGEALEPRRRDVVVTCEDLP